MQDVSGHTRIDAATSVKEHASEHGSLHQHSLNGFPQEFGMKDSYEVSDFLNIV